MLFGIVNIGYSQSDCATNPTSAFYHNTMNGAAMGTYDDPVVIRMYIHLVRQGNGSGGVDATNLQNQIDWLDMWYNPHNLFFDYCILEVNCADCWVLGLDGRIAIKDLWITNSLDDGINCYLFPSSFNQTPEAEDVGSKNCFSFVDFTTTAHEVGHCLGLFHTFESSVCPPTVDTEYSPYYDQNQNLVNGANCDDAGDMICDTPADPRCYGFVSGCIFSNPNQTLDYAGHPFIDPDNILPKNIMSYWNCRQEFTAGQNIRMRDVLADDMVIGQVVSPFSHIRTVSGTEVWTTPKYFNHDLQVYGALTISTEVGFSPGCGIILNGALIINGGTLTLSSYENTCPVSNDKLWKGILINRSLTNTPGLYISNNSIIEHAHQAISFNGPGNQFVIASNSIFRNNRITFNNIRSAAGTAKFTNCDFVINNNYLLSSYFPQLNTVHSAPTFIGGCSFNFEPTLPSSITRQAINSYNGQVLVVQWNNERSVFENWSNAIRAYQNDGSKLTLVRGADFIGNWRSIYDFNFQRMMVYDNTFDMSNDDISDESWGIFSENARQINFHDNQFLSTNSDIFSTGIYSVETRSDNVVIGENDFTDLDVGVEAITAGTENGGMMFLCNRNDGNRLYDFKTEFGIGPNHGTIEKPAGNTFSHADNEDHDSDFRAVDLPGNYEVNYYYDRLDTDQTPLYYSNTIDIWRSENYDCDHFILFQDPVASTELSHFLDTNDDLLDEIADKQDELDQPALTAGEIRDLSAELALLQLEHDVNASHTVAFVLSRDTIDFTDLRTAFDLRDDFPFAVARAHTYLVEGDTTTMFGELESISNRITLTQDEEDDLSEILLLDSMLHRVYMEGRIEDDLLAAELDTVEFLAEEGVGIARDHARALLCYFYDQCYDVVLPLQSPVDAEVPLVNNSKHTNPVLVIAEDQEVRSIYEVGIVSLYSIDGRLVKSVELDGSLFNPMLWLTEDLSGGLYLLVITTDKGNEVIVKWVK